MMMIHSAKRISTQRSSLTTIIGQKFAQIFRTLEGVASYHSIISMFSINHNRNKTNRKKEKSCGSPQSGDNRKILLGSIDFLESSFPVCSFSLTLSMRVCSFSLSTLSILQQMKSKYNTYFSGGIQRR